MKTFLPAPRVQRALLGWIELASIPWTLVGLPGCSGDDLVPVNRDPNAVPTTWQGEVLDVAIAEGAFPPCGASLERLDKTLMIYDQLLGSGRYAERRARMVVLPKDRFEQYYCTVPGAAACASGRDIYAMDSYAYTPHELVHVSRGASGEFSSFFEEGLAELYGEGYYVGPAEPLDDPEVVLDVPQLPPGQYAPAAYVVGKLVKKEGLEATVSFMDSLFGFDDFRSITTLYQDQFGEPLDWLWADRDPGANCSSMANSAHVVDCSEGTPVELTTQAPREIRPGIDSRTFQCSDPNVVGPNGNRMLSTQLFSVPRAGEVFVFAWFGPNAVAEPGRFIDVVRCGAPCESPVDWRFTETTRPPAGPDGEILPIEAGTYLVRFVDDARLPGEAYLRIRLRYEQ